jgi:diketogulonate reductase-like aldo/keto reductase
MTTRREFLTRSSAAAFATTIPAGLIIGQETLPTRPLPGTDEALPVIGLGGSRLFEESDMAGSMELIRLFHGRGGRYIDCRGLSRFVVAEVAKAMDAADELFLGCYFHNEEEATMRANIQRLLEITGKRQLDLIHAWTEWAVPNWDLLRAWKDEGLTRYIGVSRHNKQYYDDMMALMQTGTVDIVQVNYSALEREAEEEVLPMARDLGVGVVINRPFMNGDYFRLVRDHELPGWATEFNCHSWAQFSLKFILSHPAVNCVLTETSNPEHAIDNIGAGFGLLPDQETRERIFAHLKSLG